MLFFFNLQLANSSNSSGISSFPHKKFFTELQIDRPPWRQFNYRGKVFTCLL